MVNSTYLSSDELERYEAFGLGYSDVCQHPREVRKLIPGHCLVIDFDHVLFDDKDAAVALAREAADSGMWVGIHGYCLNDPRLLPVLGRPNVVVDKTHASLHAGLRKKGWK
jgi:hypothetical protein